MGLQVCKIHVGPEGAAQEISCAIKNTPYGGIFGEKNTPYEQILGSFGLRISEIRQYFDENYRFIGNLGEILSEMSIFGALFLAVYQQKCLIFATKTLISRRNRPKKQDIS